MHSVIVCCIPAVKLDYEPRSVHTFPKSNANCSHDSPLHYNTLTLSCLAVPHAHAVNSGDEPVNQMLQHSDTRMPTSFYRRKFSHTFRCISSDRITHGIQSVSREISQVEIKKSLSIGTLHDGYPDGRCVSGTMSGDKVKFVRHYSSLNDLRTSTHDNADDDDDEDYVIQSLYSGKNDYLELLPLLKHEKFQDGHPHDKMNQL